jgi:FMN phosphatase YigB (HAD superfamily)
MVGDNIHADIETPLRLGMHTVLVRDGDAQPAPASEARPHRTVRSIAELLPID